MKIFYLLLLLTFLVNASCKEQRANGQSGSVSNIGKSNDTNIFSVPFGNTNSSRSGSDVMANGNVTRETNIRINENDENLPYVKTQIKPAGRIIKLKEHLINENLRGKDLSGADWRKIGAVLESRSFCESDFGAIYNIENDAYILELVCGGNTEVGGYIYYFIDEKAMTAKLLSFERFELNNRNKQMEKHIFNYLIGESGFNENTKTMYFRHFYYAGGQCGWESRYKFINATAILTDFRAEWNCEQETEFDGWKKLDLKRLRQTAKKTIYYNFKR